ncbi:hypothetical protein K439DRAFT_1634306 [Ramaria rubella]|nr:hypothetical protein K439DRAFT_1643509 [Ramaria rubella]KAF8572544.1 hypothetical protein K439DRAFT_1643507 [Ramaria rubella]KAF8583595.1 hypothetical protein K439DRAFT_1634306 [Ramaria rubella]
MVLWNIQTLLNECRRSLSHHGLYPRRQAANPTNWHVNFLSLLTNLRLLKVDAVFLEIELGILLSQPQLHIVQLCKVDCSEAATWGLKG